MNELEELEGLEIIQHVVIKCHSDAFTLYVLDGCHHAKKVLKSLKRFDPLLVSKFFRIVPLPSALEKTSQGTINASPTMIVRDINRLFIGSELCNMDTMWIPMLNNLLLVYNNQMYQETWVHLETCLPKTLTSLVIEYEQEEMFCSL